MNALYRALSACYDWGRSNHRTDESRVEVTMEQAINRLGPQFKPLVYALAEIFYDLGEAGDPILYSRHTVVNTAFLYALPQRMHPDFFTNLIMRHLIRAKGFDPCLTHRLEYNRACFSLDEDRQ